MINNKENNVTDLELFFNIGKDITSQYAASRRCSVIEILELIDTTLLTKVKLDDPSSTCVVNERYYQELLSLRGVTDD